MGHLTRIIRSVRRKIYDLSVHAGLAPYKRQWRNTAADWDRDYLSGRLDAYADLSDRGRYGVLGEFIRAFPRKPRILDIGCGVGLLLGRIGSDACLEYVGVDPSRVAVEKAQARGVENARFLVGNAPTPDLGRFDVIVMNEVVYYIEDLPRMLDIVRRHLVEDGWLTTSILRHPGAIALDRTLASKFEEHEAFLVKRAKTANAWRVACYHPRSH